MPLASGAQIGAYTIVRLIGEGNMGAVYEALAEDETHVAIKMMRAGYSSEPSLEARFDREITIMMTLRHPHIVPCLDFGEYDGQMYVVMAHIVGVSLDVWLRSHFFSPMDVLELLEPLCSALDHAHALNIIHRDVKPSNILLDMRGEQPVLYLADFGLSKMVDVSSLTDTRMQVGTPNYMSPEQAEDLPLTPATDVYALSIVAYELLLRQLPYDAQTDFEMTVAHVRTAPRPPSQVVEGFPPALETVLLTGLHKQPAHRYPSAGAFCDAFRLAVESLDEAARTTVYRYV